MIGRFLAEADLGLYPSLGLLVFAAFFSFLPAWIFRRNSGSLYRRMSCLVLDAEDTRPEPPAREADR